MNPKNYNDQYLTPRSNFVEEAIYSSDLDKIGSKEEHADQMAELSRIWFETMSDPIQEPDNQAYFEQAVSISSQNPKKICQSVLFAIMATLYGTLIGGSFTNLQTTSQNSKTASSSSVSTPYKRSKPTQSTTNLEKHREPIERFAHQALTATNQKVQFKAIKDFVSEFKKTSKQEFTTEGNRFTAYKSGSPAWKDLIAKAPNQFQSTLKENPKHIIILPKIHGFSNSLLDGKAFEDNTIVITRSSPIETIGIAIHESVHLKKAPKDFSHLQDELRSFEAELQYYLEIAKELKSKGLFSPLVEKQIITNRQIVINGKYLMKRGLKEIYPKPTISSGQLVKYLDQKQIHRLALEVVSIDRKQDRNIKIAAQIALHKFQISNAFKLRDFLTKEYIKNPAASDLHRSNAISLILHELPFLAQPGSYNKEPDSTIPLRNKRQLRQIRREHKSAIKNTFLDHKENIALAPLVIQAPTTIPQNRIPLPPVKPSPQLIPRSYFQLSSEHIQSPHIFSKEPLDSPQTYFLSNSDKAVYFHQGFSLEKELDSMPAITSKVNLSRSSLDHHIISRTKSFDSNTAGINLPNASAFNGNDQLARKTQRLAIQISQNTNAIWKIKTQPDPQILVGALKLMSHPKVKSNPYLLAEAYKLYVAATFKQDPQIAIEKVRELFAPGSFDNGIAQVPIRFFTDHPEKTFYSKPNQVNDYIVGIEVLIDLAARLNKENIEISKARKVYTHLTILAIIDDLRLALGIDLNQIQPDISAEDTTKAIWQKIVIERSKKAQQTIRPLLYQQQNRKQIPTNNLKPIQSTSYLHNNTHLYDSIFKAIALVYLQLKVSTKSIDNPNSSLHIPTQFTKRADFPLLRPEHDTP